MIEKWSKQFDPDTILLVTWVDSFGAGPGWTEFESIDDDVEIICTSVGYPIKESRDYVVIVPHVHGDVVMEGLNKKITASGCGEMGIPKVSIRSTAILTPIKDPCDV